MSDQLWHMLLAVCAAAISILVAIVSGIIAWSVKNTLADVGRRIDAGEKAETSLKGDFERSISELRSAHQTDRAECLALRSEISLVKTGLAVVSEMNRSGEYRLEKFVSEFDGLRGELHQALEVMAGMSAKIDLLLERRLSPRVAHGDPG